MTIDEDKAIDQPLLDTNQAAEQLHPDVEEDADRPLIDDLQAAQDPTLDSIETYLREIGRVSLLSAAEEVELAEQMTRGEAASRRLESGEDLTPQLRTALHSDVDAG